MLDTDRRRSQRRNKGRSLSSLEQALRGRKQPEYGRRLESIESSTHHSASFSPFAHFNEPPPPSVTVSHGQWSDHSVLDLLRRIGADMMLTTVGQAGLLGHSGANARLGWATSCGPSIGLTETGTVLLSFE